MTARGPTSSAGALSRMVCVGARGYILDAAARRRAVGVAAIAATVLWLHLLLLDRAGERVAVAAAPPVRIALLVRAVAAPEIAPLAPAPYQSETPPRPTPERGTRRPTLAQAPAPAAPATVIAAMSTAPVAPSTPAMAPQPYPTQLPPPATLHYELRRGALAGRGALHWQHDGERYDARLDAQLDGSPVLQWASRGGFDAAGVAPERFVAHGRRRSAQAVNFQRDAGKITFSGPTVEHALLAGAQDRLSWMLQLAAIAAARPPAAGEQIVMQVAGPRGDAEAWQFDVVGDAVIDTDIGPVPALRLVREPRRRYDTRIEVWLDPARHHLPVRALLGNAGDDRDPLEMLLRSGSKEAESSS